MTVQVSVKREAGAPYMVTTIRVDGVVIRSQLGPMSPEEIAEHVRAHLAPKPPAPRFIPYDGAPRGRPKRKAPTMTRTPPSTPPG